jgi:hypothetical protein
VDAAGLERKLQLVINDMESPRMLKELGDRLATSVADAVRATPVAHGSLQDLSMSGWPVELVGYARVISPTEVAVQPKGRAVGQFRILQDGRKDYAAGDMRSSGTYVSKKTGERKQKTRKVKQNVTGHGGKGTWSDAEARMLARAGPEWAGRFDGVMARFFTRG